jgi:hypothetical protein
VFFALSNFKLQSPESSAGKPVFTYVNLESRTGKEADEHTTFSLAHVQISFTAVLYMHQYP